MPKRAAPGDRELIEAALSDELHRALATLCNLLDIPFGLIAKDKAGWQGTILQDVIETAAVLERARHHQSLGLAADPALRRACEELGIPHKTVVNRLDRAYRASRVRLPADTHYEDTRPGRAA
ncbi:MAG: hypothetical protein OEZ65_17010 [Gemmatimonadota bacterium]|nr:hypothetical protein [Gemmatimonadota bacterium]